MYAVIEAGGKQYRVSPGDTIEVNRMEGEPGATVELGRVLAVVGDGSVKAGKDAGAKVSGTIVAHGRGDKIRVFKFKRKKQYKKTIGHRQDLTTVKVGDIA
ncbi:MAG: 50S ribosomal protein L21 [Bryobacteraceae bacterium]